MILEVALLDVLPGRTQGVGKSFAEASKIISSAPGYLSHELQRCIETPSATFCWCAGRCSKPIPKASAAPKRTENGSACSTTSTTLSPL